MIKYDFGTEYTFNAKTDTTEINVRVDAETLDEIVDAFTSFLRAAGFYIDGEFVIERLDSRVNDFDDVSADLVGFPEETDNVVGLSEEDYEEVLGDLSETVRAWFDTPEYRAAAEIIKNSDNMNTGFAGTVSEPNFQLGEVFTFNTTDKLSIIKERN